ncbi:alpha-amylase family glycosyl hydrolase [Dyella sp. RRB7]|uniref:alpha-amylase family glycosyl hydrolase n=1 Tax=Dyella sp. RRB7 TaxID=2919502 RepID=UPI001FA9E86D|nr:alpha-amylase family glycosyl hydrolase [Dyella sp. RRB7]
MSRNRSFKPLAFLLSLALGSSAGLPGNAHAAEAPAPPATTSAASGVYYEIFVRAWYDTNGDGIGDLNGVTAKLDYLKSLGISGIWLMPINTSPSYHGYDITDYYGINAQYGNEADLQHLLEEAHKRGIAVTMDMVINHTSEKHPWFIAARNPADPHHDWYTWADAHADLNALSTASDEKIWHPLGDAHGAAAAYYLGDFGGGMPDLNYDNPAVRAEMIKVGQYWIAKGVDGFRLDAAKHIYDDFKARQHDPDVIAKNVAWWTQFHEALATINPQVTLVGEVSAKSPTQLAPYLKPLGSIFDFPLAEQLIVSAKGERVGKLDSLLKDTYAAYRSAGDVPFIDSTFLSNHDQERVMSRLGGHAEHMRMAAAMLLTLPGRPYLYYGEELGMEGRKPDPNLREPMRWQRQPGPGESRWKPSSVNQGEAVSVQAEQDDPHSLLNYYRMLISWRAQVPALRDGDLQLQATGHPRLLAYWRNDGSQHVLVVHNLGGKDTLWKPAGTTLPKNAAVLLSSTPDAKLENGRVKLPAYSTVVLQ